MKILPIILLTLLLAGCVKDVPVSTRPDATEKPGQLLVLETDGYENIELAPLDPIFSGCSDSDSYFWSKRFKAKKNDKTVEGVVCGAMFKGYTVRVQRVY